MEKIHLDIKHHSGDGLMAVAIECLFVRETQPWGNPSILGSIVSKVFILRKVT